MSQTVLYRLNRPRPSCGSKRRPIFRDVHFFPRKSLFLQKSEPLLI